jgi:hypothetical protein
MKFLKYKFILVLLVSIKLINAQTTSPCDNADIRTDPANPSSLPISSATNATLRLLDWKLPKWDWQKQNAVPPAIVPPLSTIQNPYIASGNPNVQIILNAILSNADNQPSEGWELLTYNDGTQLDGYYQWRQSDYDFPYVLLYNKYRAIIRCFILYNREFSTLDYNSATITLQYVNNKVDGTFQSANISNYASSQKPIDAFDKKTHAQSANRLTINGYQWLYADFPIAYDPCVCNNTYSKFQIGVNLVETADVNLDGTIKTLETTNKNGNVVNPGLGIAGGSEIGKDLTKALKVYKDDKEFITNLLGLFTAQAKGTDKADLAKTTTSSGSSVNKELFELIKIGSSAIPYAGLVFSLIDNLSADSKPAAPTQVAFAAKTNLNGTITYSQLGAINAFLKVPGSLEPTNLLNEEKPFYNEPLGVFNLMNTPELEFVDYYTDYNNFGSFGPDNNNLPNAVQPFIRQYKIKTVPKVVINPSSDLELEDIRYTVRVGYHAHPSDKNTIFDGSFNTMLCWATSEQFNLNNKEAINTQNFYDYKGFFIHDKNSSPSLPHFVTIKPFPVINFKLAGAGNFQGYNTNIDKEMKKIGLEYENWPKTMPYADPLAKVIGYINTNYHPYSWLPYQTFYAYAGNMVTNSNICGDLVHGASDGGKPIFELKVQCIFKRKDNEDAKPLIHTITFPIKVVESQLNKNSDGSPRHFCDIKLDPTINGFKFELKANNISNSTVWHDPLRMPFDLKFDNEIIGPGDIRAIHNIVFGDNVTVMPGTNFYAGNLIMIEGNNTIIPPSSIIEIMPIPAGVATLSSSDYLLTDASDLCLNKLTYNPEVESKSINGVNNSNLESLDFRNPIEFTVYPNPALAFFKIVLSEIGKKNFSNLKVLDLTGKSTLVFDQLLPTYDVSNLSNGSYLVEVNLKNGSKLFHKLIINKE